MVNVEFPETPPPGAGLFTETLAEPALARSPGRITAMSCEPLRYDVARAVPFHSTVEVGTKFEPFTNSCKPAVPLGTEMLLGDSEETPGDGLLLPVIVKSTTGDSSSAFAVFTTETPANPELATSVLVIAAVNCVALTKVVVRDWLFQLTTSFAAKFEPFTVRVKFCPPAEAFAGENDEIAGSPACAGSIVKKAPEDVPPPGAGLETVICAVPAVTKSEAGMVTCN